MINIIGDWESGNGDWENGNGDWGMRKMGNKNVVLSISKNGWEWGMGIGEWGLGNGFQNGECIRAKI